PNLRAAGIDTICFNFMAHLIGLYTSLGIDVPIRVDHVPTMASDNNSLPGYSTTGRLIAIGYLKGLLERAK
ncbi:MAG: mannonate dehydratase, partial [Clostridia bacterium]|nr:mannonate dehydratase [Clostridia bacterium]